MTESPITITDLHFAYSRNNPVLKNLNLTVPQSSIFGFLGRNGAGKTTTIKLMLGLLKPDSGSCSILDNNPATNPINVRKSVGYMAEDQQMYHWMNVRQIINWVASFYPDWDHKLTDSLLDSLHLPRKLKIKALSKGQNSSLALLLALGHKPKLVILDDPTLGLDPIARKDFLRHLITLLQSQGTTVFFSSHLLYEIEPVADQIAILDQGQIIKTASTEQLRHSVRRFIFTPKDESILQKINNPPQTVESDIQVEGIIDLTTSNHAVSITVENCTDQTRSAIASLAASDPHESALNLDEIFEAYILGSTPKVPTS